MVKSVIARIFILAGLVTIILLGAFAVYTQFDEKNFSKNSKNLAAISDGNTALDPVAPEDVEVIQLASLTIGEQKPMLEVLETPESIMIDTQAALDMASQLASEKKFETALGTLERIHSSRQEDYSVRFLEARILSWSGKHRAAERAFERLKAKYPQDLDVMVSYGYHHVYQRRYGQAEAIFVEVLKQNPDYMDAQNGLERSRLAQNSK